MVYIGDFKMEKVIHKREDIIDIMTNHANAYTLFQRGEYEEAETYYMELLQRDINDVEALLKMGCIEMSNENYFSAEVFLKQALFVRPKHIDVILSLALLYRKQEIYDKYLSCLEKVLNIDENNRIALFSIISFYSDFEDSVKLKEYTDRFNKVMDGSMTTLY